jgi:peptidoglycan hydrolase-like protein with peptidoglycan-binding domain
MSPAHAKPSRLRSGAHNYLLIAMVVVVVALLGGVGALVAVRARPASAGITGGSASTTGAVGGAFAVSSTTPARGSTGFPSDGTVVVRFSTPLSPISPMPSLKPSVPGTWRRASATSVEFVPSMPLPPYSKETITIPGGISGVRSADGATLRNTETVSFDVADASMLRLQQLLAELHYLPLTFSPTTPVARPRDLAEVQHGTFTWRWTPPAWEQALWTPGVANPITQGAVMAFQHQNGMANTGIATAATWTALFQAVRAGNDDQEPYDYVYVSKTLPETLTLYREGKVVLTSPTNTGLPGYPTTDGTYPIYLRFTENYMSGTNPNGTHYHDLVHWINYFNGSEAVHGFVRAAYGFPQSLGCAELPVATAGKVYPYLAIGDLVTIAN